MKLNFFIPFLLSVFTLVGCSDDAGGHKHPELSSGKQLFEHHCAECHQKDAKGKYFYGFPDLVDLKLDINRIRVQVLGEDTPGRKMPSFSSMPDEEVQKIAEYIVSLK